jgi:hypothetical protein
MRVVYDENTLGFTQNSINFLRTSLAERINSEIAVIEVPAGGSQCGFLIIARDMDETIWSGHGFRQDYNGVGGRAYRKLVELFAILGVRVQSFDSFALSEKYPQMIYDSHDTRDVENKIKFFSENIIRELKEDGYHVPSRQNVPF